MHTVPTSLTQMYYVLRTLPTDFRGYRPLTCVFFFCPLFDHGVLTSFIPLSDFLSYMHMMCCETTKILLTKQSKQLVFEGDFPKLGIGLGVLAVIGAGYGSMYFGMWHQQKKQGYWK